MSKRKNEEVLKSIMSENYLRYTKDALKNAMLHQEVAGQRVFYVFLKQHGYDINPEDMDKCQSDGIIGNCIIECKLNEDEGGGPKKAAEELYTIIPNRLKSKGLRVPYYRIYVELETFLVEVLANTENDFRIIDSFDWYENPEKFKQYFEDKENLYSYDLSEETVDLVEVIQNIYTEYNIKDKLEAYKKLEEGIKGWFLPFDIKKVNINKLILNNDKMNEKYVQKVQGAFFTPSQYVKISTEYVLKAIEESKKDGYDDYVVVDRCAGVGNLESMFPEEVYSHLILGTINEAEALTANIRFNGLCEVIVQDALSRDGVLLYKQKIEERIKSCKKLAVIFLENPPYLSPESESRSVKNSGRIFQKNSGWSFVKTEMKNSGVNMQHSDLDEHFIWSCFEIYKPYAYIHYGPIKSWKSRHLIDKEVKSAYLCNRKYFNASEAAIALIWWSGKDKNNEYIDFDSDIDNKKYRIKKVNEPSMNLISWNWTKEEKEDSVFGLKLFGLTMDTGSYIMVNLTDKVTDGHPDWYRWYVKEDVLKTLPLYCAAVDKFTMSGKMLSTKETDYRCVSTICKTADGGIKYQEDDKFLQDCLLWSLCTAQHKCSSESKFYKVCEELLDKTHKETEIYKLYKSLVEKTGKNGFYNIKKFKGTDRDYGKMWVYLNFNDLIDKLENILDIYFYEVLRPKFFEYELLK